MALYILIFNILGNRNFLRRKINGLGGCSFCRDQSSGERVNGVFFIGTVLPMAVFRSLFSYF